MMKYLKNKKLNIKDDALAGITVSLAMIPEVVAFAFVAQISPIVALFGAFVVGIISAVFGGRPGLISGAAGAVAVIFVHMIQEGHAKGLLFENPVENMGYFYLLAAVVLMGIIQIFAGLFKLGKFVRLIPHPVMMGFVNGLAIVIFMAQLGMFTENTKDFFGQNKRKTTSKELVYNVNNNEVKDVLSGTVLYTIKDASVINNQTKSADFIISDGQVFNPTTKKVIFNVKEDGFYSVKDSGVVKSAMQGEKLYIMIGLVLLTMFIVWGLPKITTKIPAALTAILVVTLISIFSGLNAINVGDFIRDGGGAGLNGIAELSKNLNVLELWSNLPFNLETLKFIAPYAFLAASVGLIETLMTMNLVDELTETRGNGNKECIAQGAGNMVSGLFGGTGGCGMIGQTVININAGGRGRLSGVMMSLTLLTFILFADKYIEQVPIAALVGVMFMMVIETFAWSSFRIMKKIPASDAFVLIIVSAVTVFFDLAIAVFVGVIISALSFAWSSAKKIRARKRLKADGTRVYEIWGPLFFGSITEFNDKFDIKNDPENVEIDFVESRISDHSALEALFLLVEKYQAAGKTIKLKHLSEDCKVLMYKASDTFKNVIIEDVDDPRYHLAENPEAFPKPLSEYKF
ncbi:SulP family inorganic anion transporter [Tenacibaculum finnmarkense]|uniref:SulP family inorganic anion transporter n=1 Tax=Tenacibaculum finnmarkense genomovar finnmarkense TaxID=1458503 RepID=A0AAP1WH60_9FLAO|nr:SulP family inorganic anion transporter [Tenacibaculum finnmarkense]MBE7653721.1 SulP family inorganic anion transporter [Tenacibaculum finnmarkense genomovar finnmarkense]MBE7696025.1 SulP family inorganic anion transporter [Tenacibaculum finnmarkense genomovar finnmarkense]MCD8428239.1 SulP family inorganic anion transporter [Tenacibaculum finnmarkense genomovar finnmarkense]MCG8731994.1 SulP family inorganic anion transporter [Tenacibaculum finnmarkense]MCG8752350.1 SulP family inorganic